MPANDAFEAATFGQADGIHIIARREQIGAENISRFHFFGEVPEFFDAFDRNAAELLDVPKQWLGHAVFFLIVKTELNRIIPVALLRFALHNAVRSGEDDRNMDHDAFGIVNPRLAQFFSK
jgi:hypothetical protein